MPTPTLTDDLALEAAILRASCASDTEAARHLGIARSTFQNRLKRAAERGLVAPGTETMPGYRIDSLTTTPNGTYVKQRKEHGEEYTPTLPVKGRTTLVDAEGRVITQHIMERATAEAHAAAMRAAVDGFKDEIPRVPAVTPPEHSIADLLCQYTITDAHLGALAWNEETGGGDYDLSIGERLVVDWFAAAIASAPPAKRAVFAQIGDFLHYDSFKSVTPEHGHLLDGDTRYPKMVRTAIRVVRTVLRMLLEKHEQIDVIMADDNHSPSGEVWLREMFAAFFEDEPRIRVDTNPGTYSFLEHGLVSLYYHHGHRRKISNVDSVFVGRFREVYGRTKFSYAHIGHLHSDELKSTNLMKVERHETLAAPDAYAANGGWLSGRSAKVIIYHAQSGEVGRYTLTPEMVAGAAKRVAANDNEPVRRAA